MNKKAIIIMLAIVILVGGFARVGMNKYEEHHYTREVEVVFIDRTGETFLVDTTGNLWSMFPDEQELDNLKMGSQLVVLFFDNLSNDYIEDDIIKEIYF